MRLLFASLLSLLFTLPLLAQTTVTLGSESCTGTNICFNVPNDAGLTIDYLSNAIQYQRLVISIDGELFDSGLWVVKQPVVSQALYDVQGNVIYATLDFTVTHGTCFRAGRVTVCPRYVTLNSGSLVFP